MIPNKKEFFIGLFLAITFFIILGIMFMPLFNGENAFHASDKLFNSIAKGSTYYIADLIEKNSEFKSIDVAVELEFDDTAALENAEKILSSNSIEAVTQGNKLIVTGSLGSIIEAALKDADLMFYNNGAEVSRKYGLDEKLALFTWWDIMTKAEKSLKFQKKFKEAAFVHEIIAKGVEVGYNFYKVEPQKSTDRLGILTFSLLFYVFYTLWWGFAIFYLFEGVGLVMKAGTKKEM